MLCAALGLFAILSLMRFHQPVAQDDLHWLVAAKTLHTDGVARQYAVPERVAGFSPHLYLGCIALMFKLFGVDESIARLPGLAFGLLSILMVFGLTRHFSKGSEIERTLRASTISLLCASSPALAQGSVIIDIDNTLLVPSLLLLCGAFAKYLQEERMRWAVLAALSVSVALWGRVTTPALVCCALCGAVLLSRKPLRTKLTCVGLVLAGALLFVTTWYGYCRATGTPFAEPFRYTWRTARRGIGPSLGAVLENVVYLTLWIGLFPLLLILKSVIERGRRFFKAPELRVEDVFLLGGGIPLLGYTLMAQPLFGYPKYQIPEIPLLFIFMGLALPAFEAAFADLRPSFAVVLAALFVQVLTAGDPLYLLRYSLREAQAFMTPSAGEVLKTVAIRAGLFAAASFLLFKACSRFSAFRSRIGLLILFSVGSTLGLSLLQSAAGYHTGYNYGGRGTLEVARYVRERVPTEGVVLAPSEVIYYLALPNSRHLPNDLWSDVGALQQRLTDPRTSGFVYSIATHSVLQVRTISGSQSVQDILRRQFDHTKIGSYEVWVRKTPL